MFAVAVEHTIVELGENLDPRMLQLLKNETCRKHVFLIADGTFAEIDALGGNAYQQPGTDFPNVAAENGVYVRIGGSVTQLIPAEPGIPALFKEITDYLDAWDPQEVVFFRRPRTVSYVAGYDDFDYPPIAQMELLKHIMDDQASKHLQFTVKEGLQTVEFTLRDVNKHCAFKYIEGSFPNHLWVACGASREHDGPMLDDTHKGIMVANPYSHYPVVPGVEDMITVLEWFVSVIEAKALQG